MMRDEDKGFEMLGRVVGDKSARFKHRWFGILQVETEEGRILSLYMSGSVAQWLKDGERVEVKVLKEREEGKEREGGQEILLFDEYELFKFCEERESSENEGRRGEEKGGRKGEGQSEQSEKRERGERKLKVWPVWEKVVRFERRDALDLNTLYEYDLSCLLYTSPSPRDRG